MGLELRVGVLALQGGFEAHAGILRRLGAEVCEVRTEVDMEGLDGLVVPGGESAILMRGTEVRILASTRWPFGKPGTSSNMTAGLPILRI